MLVKAEKNIKQKSLHPQSYEKSDSPGKPAAADYAVRKQVGVDDLQRFLQPRLFCEPLQIKQCALRIRGCPVKGKDWKPQRLDLLLSEIPSGHC